mgnify:CR=1 FL=1
MEVQIFGTKKCKDTQKAERFFKERGIKVHFVDLTQKAVSQGELNNITRSVPLDDLIDREGKQFKKRNLEYMVFDTEQELLKDPLLFRTPIVRFSGKATAGHEPDTWSEWVEQNK